MQADDHGNALDGRDIRDERGVGHEPMSVDDVVASTPDPLCESGPLRCGDERREEDGLSSQLDVGLETLGIAPPRPGRRSGVVEGEEA